MHQNTDKVIERNEMENFSILFSSYEKGKRSTSEVVGGDLQDHTVSQKHGVCPVCPSWQLPLSLLKGRVFARSHSIGMSKKEMEC